MRIHGSRPTVLEDKINSRSLRLEPISDHFIRFGNATATSPAGFAERAFNDPRHPKIFLLDFDGTLSEFEADPANTQFKKPVIMLRFIEATGQNGDYVILNSGRPTSYLQERIARIGITKDYPHVEMSGFHGGERVNLRGEITHPLPIELVKPIQDIRQNPEFIRLMTQYPDMIISTEGCIFAVSCNNLPETKQAEAQKAFKQFAEGLLATPAFKDFAYKPGGGLDFELAPANFDKALTAERFHERFPDAMLITMGDMLNDDGTHAVANRHDGLSFHVVHPGRDMSEVVPPEQRFYGGVDDVYEFFDAYTNLVTPSST